MVNTKTGFGLTLQQCADIAGAVIVYNSLQDDQYAGRYEVIVVEHNGERHEFNHIQRAKAFLLSLVSQTAQEGV